MLTSLGKALLFWHTVGYLRPVQVINRITRKIPVRLSQAPLAIRSNTAGTWLSGAVRQASMVDADSFHLLNQQIQIRHQGDWNRSDLDDLLVYHLHYFDDLNAFDAENRLSWHRELIDRWISENKPRQGAGWDPYPLSLRVVNWIKWAFAGNEMQERWNASLVIQVRYLRKKLEYHLLGNHLIANAKALVFAGIYFEGTEAKGWLEQGLMILQDQLTEQVLADGGHYERTPMYHCIVLEDLLDLVNALGVYRASSHVESANSDRPADTLDQQAQTLKEVIKRMLNWLSVMCHPDNEISLFNDATFDAAPGYSELWAYAQRLGTDYSSTSPDQLTRLPDTGFIRMMHGSAMAILDVGSVGPDYQPAHAHAETLCFEVSLFGQRVIVNSGISCYGSSVIRLHQRGTAAHSTVTINDANSSEVWAGFRMARRARVTDLTVLESSLDTRVTCSHNGYARLPGRPIHTRQWELSRTELRVTDKVTGEYKTACAYYHLHPGVQVLMGMTSNEGTLVLENGQVAGWTVTGGSVSTQPSEYHPGFGRSLAAQCIRVRFLDKEIHFHLSWG